MTVHAKATLKNAIVEDGRATRLTMTPFEPHIMAAAAIKKCPFDSRRGDEMLFIAFTPFATLIM